MIKNKKLITNEIKNLVVSACKGNIKITKYKIEHYNRFRIGRATITMIKGQTPVLNVGEDFTTEYRKLWVNDVGKILMRELKKKEPQLYELKTSSFKTLLKKIDDDEFQEFEQNDFNHLNIGDLHYTIIKAVSKKNMYSDFTDDYEFEFDEDIIENKKDDKDDNIKEDEQQETYALF